MRFGIHANHLEADNVNVEGLPQGNRQMALIYKYQKSSATLRRSITSDTITIVNRLRWKLDTDMFRPAGLLSPHLQQADDSESTVGIARLQDDDSAMSSASI